MSLNAKTRRRWFGALCLLAAIAMLVAGETVLTGRLSAFGFLLWWLACFVCTALAIRAALVDVRELQRESHDEQRALFENTLEKIREEKARKASTPSNRKPADGTNLNVEA